MSQGMEEMAECLEINLVPGKIVCGLSCGWGDVVVKCCVLFCAIMFYAVFVISYVCISCGIE